MSKRKQATKKIVEFKCEEDPKDKKHLVCEETTTDIDHSTPDVEPARSNIIIGAINIGARPIKEYFAARWGRHYHPRLPHGGKHLVADILMAVAIIGLVGWNLFFWLSVAPRPSDLELQVSSQSKQGQLNQPISFRVLYSNESENSLQDINISLRPSSGLKITEVKGADFNVESQRVVVGNLLSGEIGEFDVIVTPTSFGHQNLQVITDGVIVVAPVDISKPQLNFKAFARYYSPEGDQIGRGPLPPKVGETTKYQIYWILENGPYELKAIMATGTLADNVIWTDFTPLGGDELMYDFLTRKVTWKPSKVKTSLDLSPSLGAIFEVALRPTSGQKGQIVPLLSEIKISGKEQLTDMILETGAEDITTVLVNDKKAEGKGIIQ